MSVDIAETFAARELAEKEAQSPALRSVMLQPALRRIVLAMMAVSYAEGRKQAFIEALAVVRERRSGA